ALKKREKSLESLQKGRNVSLIINYHKSSNDNHRYTCAGVDKKVIILLVVYIMFVVYTKLLSLKDEK
ncbi:hypothetical protein, partial [Flavobacterium sp.]|uniref:hypothetical protein n=1 Tax=Flavobacterium sp. TaxID=239 RepID=UPI00375118DF